MRRLLALAAGAAAALVVSGPALAAVDAYLKIDGVDGESKTVPNSIEVSSFSWGASQGRGMGSPMGGSSDRESSAPSVSEIVVTRVIDKASPKLAKCASTGCHYPTATLYVRKAGGGQTEYLLSNVSVSRYSTSSGGDRPSESLTLNFTKITMKAAPQAGETAMQTHTALPPPGPAKPH